MRKSMFIAVLTTLMAAPILFTSCSSDDDLTEDIVNEHPTTDGVWIEPYHIQGASIEKVKAYMLSTMKSYAVKSQTETSSSIQLAYSTGDGEEGILYSFSSLGGLYSVISTEKTINKTKVLKYLTENYQQVTEAGGNAEMIEYFFVNSDKSMVVSTGKVSDVYFNVNYAFVSK